jgi:hypothetical protein
MLEEGLCLAGGIQKEKSAGHILLVAAGGSRVIRTFGLLRESAPPSRALLYRLGRFGLSHQTGMKVWLSFSETAQLTHSPTTFIPLPHRHRHTRQYETTRPVKRTRSHCRAKHNAAIHVSGQRNINRKYPVCVFKIEPKGIQRCTQIMRSSESRNRTGGRTWHIRKLEAVMCNASDSMYIMNSL